MELQLIVTDVTYDELVALIAAEGLEVGCYYRITDYQTKHYMLDGVLDPIEEDINTGDVEPLMVLATSSNTLDKQARSEQYPQDIIYYDWNPENWKYDVGFAAYNEEVLPDWKGCIYFRHDTRNDNYVGYDFRKVKFRRWALAEAPDGFNTVYAGLTSADGIDAGDYEDFLTFHFTEEVYNRHVLANHIEPMRWSSQEWMHGILSNVVFMPEAYDDPDNFGWYQVYLNEFGSGMYDCTFGGYCESNTVGGYFYNNTVGADFFNNIVGVNFRDNTVGVGFFNNTVGVGFGYNTVGVNFVHNIVGVGFRHNTVGVDFGYNTVGVSFGHNTVGVGFMHNTVGAYFRYNTVQNEVRHIETPDRTNNNEWRGNVIRDRIQGTSGTPLVLDHAQFVTDTNCEVFRRSDGEIRMKYMDDQDNIIVESPTT